jgi:DNA-binding NarL/FixJ family response regulator
MSPTRSAAELSQLEPRLATVIDVLPDGVAICDTSGRIIQRSVVLAALLAADAEAPRLVAEICRVAAEATCLTGRRGTAAFCKIPCDASALREVRTATRLYRLHARHIGCGSLGPEAAVVVLVGRLGTPDPAPAELCERYALTRREVQVARLLARGRTNAEIARALGLSTATARHYTEHVLAKLGVHSRAQVAIALRTDAAE